MTKEIFEELIKKSESSTLDFKSSEYDFSSSAPESKKAEFIKDIIGIEEQNNKKLLKGVIHTTDDSILQQKIKSSVFPIPTFSYYPFIYHDLIFGIIKFPIRKYDKPIMPTKKLKGLMPGITYFRRNSSNDIANTDEIIEINEWLNSLTEIHYSFEKLIHQYLLRVLDDNLTLSKTLADLLVIGKQNNIIILKEFCTKELKGYKK